jgi:hypothetical protein
MIILCEAKAFSQRVTSTRVRGIFSGLVQKKGEVK